MVSKWTHTEGSLEENAPMTNSGKSKTSSYLGVDYGAMDFILINSIQEQQAIIQTQAEEIESQEQRIEKLEQLLDQLLNAEKSNMKLFLAFISLGFFSLAAQSSIGPEHIRCRCEQ